MTWSFSESKLFKKCQRQWYYKSKVANALAKDPIRKEAYLLSKLQSIYAWRGNLVDTVLSDYVARNMKNGANEQTALSIAKNLFDQQLLFGKNHSIRKLNTSITKLGDQFAAFFDSEYGSGPQQNQIDQAWDDVRTAIHNFFESKELLKELKSARYLVPQRSLSFTINEFKSKAVPDLIAFQYSAPPTIYDWKVHMGGYQDYRLQLACYALALTRGNPHKDFPQNINAYSPMDIKLVEVQLLRSEIREYRLTQLDIDDTEDYVERSATEMALAFGEEDNYGPFDFPSTDNPDVCSHCSYRSLCWEKRFE